MKNMSVMETLRANTWDLHKKAEDSLFMKKMIRGELDVTSLVLYFEQLYFIHRKLDLHLKDALEENSSISEAISFEQLQSERLLSDLKYHGVFPDQVNILPSTAAFIRQMKASVNQSDSALLGFHYVFEGSKMGGMIISKALIKNCDWLSAECLSYFNPYGDELFTKWAIFAQMVNNLSLNEDELNDANAAARETFLALIKITSCLGSP